MFDTRSFAASADHRLSCDDGLMCLFVEGGGNGFSLRFLTEKKKKELPPSVYTNASNFF